MISLAFGCIYLTIDTSLSSLRGRDVQSMSRYSDHYDKRRIFGTSSRAGRKAQMESGEYLSLELNFVSHYIDML